MIARVLALVVCAFLTLPLARAEEASFVLRDFAFASGEKLPQLRIHYMTWGEPKRDQNGKITNAILLCHGTMGNAGSFAGWWAASMFGPGQPLDSSKYFVIASDTIGAGKSGKPSDGMRMKFPKYRLDDVVHAQRRLLSEALGVEELVAVIGISFGGRQTWQWGIQYPDSMRGLVPIVSSPFANAGRRGMQDFLPAHAITSDPTWQGGAYKEQPRNMQLAIMMYWLGLDGAGHFWEAAPTRGRAFSYLPETTRELARSWDANDFLYQLRANEGFDAYSALDRVKARVLIVNMVADEMVPVDLHHAEKAVEKLGAKAQYLLVREASEHGHFAAAYTTGVYGPKIAEFLRALN
jgi:homoserine O-acetyltransferase/O-succinyltransferase